VCSRAPQVDFLIGAGLKPMSIVSYNHLGNNDGMNLSAPQQFRSKEISKSNVVDDMVASNPILYEKGQHPDHVVVIKCAHLPHRDASIPAFLVCCDMESRRPLRTRQQHAGLFDASQMQARAAIRTDKQLTTHSQSLLMCKLKGLLFFCLSKASKHG
jgi:hypothetical protein